jgi:2-keto-4-pentenoate hydratase
MLSPKAVNEAAALLVEARTSGPRLERLPASCAPQGVDDAHAIQDATVALLGEMLAGWKAGSTPEGSFVRAPLLRSRVFESGATIPAGLTPMLGVEAEVAFRFIRALPPRERPYTRDEVADAVIALAAIEVIDTRYVDNDRAPVLDRLADFVSNGAFVAGVEQPRWRDIDLAGLHVTLSIDGAPIVDRIGGHPSGDPLGPAVDLANAQRLRGGIGAGQFVTTGSFTGVNRARPGQAIAAVFEGLGAAQMRFGS